MAVSLPSRERGLKFCYVIALWVDILSLPSRERGLKYKRIPTLLFCECRSLRGSVD